MNCDHLPINHKSSKVGCPIDHSSDLAPQVPGSDVICPMHCLASLKFWQGTDVIDALILCLLFRGMPNLRLLTLCFIPLELQVSAVD